MRTLLCHNASPYGKTLAKVRLRNSLCLAAACNFCSYASSIFTFRAKWPPLREFKYFRVDFWFDIDKISVFHRTFLFSFNMQDRRYVSMTEEHHTYNTITILLMLL